MTRQQTQWGTRDWIWVAALCGLLMLIWRQDLRYRRLTAERTTYEESLAKELQKIDARFYSTGEAQKNALQDLVEDVKIMDARYSWQRTSIDTHGKQLDTLTRERNERHEAAPQPTRYRPQYPPPPPEPQPSYGPWCE